jgi:hypothetical protein
MAQRKQQRLQVEATRRKSKGQSRRATRNLPAPTVSRETLDSTPNRSLLLLRAIGTSKPIAARMRAYGFTQADAQEGWELLRAASGLDADLNGATDDSTAARAAIAELDASDEILFRVLNASLRRRVPAFAMKVLAGLGAGHGAAVVLAVSELLRSLGCCVRKAGRGRQARPVDSRAARLRRRGTRAAPCVDGAGTSGTGHRSELSDSARRGREGARREASSLAALVRGVVRDRARGARAA